MPKRVKVSNETKKRLLLTKWRGDLESGRKIDDVRAELDEAKETIESLEKDHAEITDDLESLLTDVKYWMLDCLVHHLPMRDPRKILRKIEDAL